MLQILLLVALIMIAYYLYDQATLKKNLQKKNTAEVQHNPLMEALVDINKKGRGDIHASNDGWFTLLYNDGSEMDNHLTFLKEHGYEGDSRSWKGIIHGALLLSDPDILDYINMEEEGEQLAIHSKKEAVLQSVARLLAKIKEDETLLIEAVQMAELNDKMV